MFYFVFDLLGRLPPICPLGIFIPSLGILHYLWFGTYASIIVAAICLVWTRVVETAGSTGLMVIDWHIGADPKTKMTPPLCSSFSSPLSMG